MLSMSPILCFTAEDLYKHLPEDLQEYYSQESDDGMIALRKADAFSVFQCGWFHTRWEDDWRSSEAVQNAEVGSFC